MRQEFFEQELDYKKMRGNPLYKREKVCNLRPNAKHSQHQKPYKHGSDFIMVKDKNAPWHKGKFNFKQLVVRWSPTGMSWGYTGQGPGDCALNILLNYYSSGSGVVTADQIQWIEKHHIDFEKEYVSRIPETGGVIKLEDVRKFIADNP